MWMWLALEACLALAVRLVARLVLVVW